MQFKINNKEYELTTQEQIDPSGRPFVNVGVEKDTNYPDKWVGKVVKNYWILTFKYTDTNEYFKIGLDYNDKVITVKCEFTW